MALVINISSGYLDNLWDKEKKDDKRIYSRIQCQNRSQTNDFVSTPMRSSWCLSTMVVSNCHIDFSGASKKENNERKKLIIKYI